MSEPVVRRVGVPPRQSQIASARAISAVVLLLISLVLVGWVGWQTAARWQPLPPLPTTTVQLGGQRVAVEIAATSAARQRGLMFRDVLPADTGMLFLFPDAQPRGFWMRNTRIPLAIAYLDAHGCIVSTAEMAPETDTVYPSAAPAAAALELPSGWFAAHGVGVGDCVTYTLPAGMTIDP